MAQKKSKLHELEIIVCIKPVPDPRKWDKLKLDPETMLLNRSQVPPVINALDLNAIEQAMQIKETNGGKVTVVTMAPPDAADQLQEALALGCDQAYLLSDIAFAGADTLATARCLAAAIKKIGRIDLVFCGAYSLDGSTSQVGPQVAELLEIPDLTHVVKLQIEGEGVKAECKTESADVIFESQFPALITFDREVNQPRLPGMVGIRRAKDISVVKWNAADLGINTDQVGLKGSPTQMLNVFTPTIGRKGEILQGSALELTSQLLSKLRTEKLLQ